MAASGIGDNARAYDASGVTKQESIRRQAIAAVAADSAAITALVNECLPLFDLWPHRGDHPATVSHFCRSRSMSGGCCSRRNRSPGMRRQRRPAAPSSNTGQRRLASRRRRGALVQSNPRLEGGGHRPDPIGRAWPDQSREASATSTAAAPGVVDTDIAGHRRLGTFCTEIRGPRPGEGEEAGQCCLPRPAGPQRGVPTTDRRGGHSLPATTPIIMSSPRR